MSTETRRLPANDAARIIQIPTGSVALEGELSVPINPQGLVIFAHGNGSSRHSPRNRAVAEVLQRGRIGTLKAVARSFYKARGHGKLPMCVICGGPGEGGRQLVTLTHGVAVWLCAAHRSAEFMTRRAGRDFAASLMAVFRAAGCHDGRRSRAVQA